MTVRETSRIIATCMPLTKVYRIFDIFILLAICSTGKRNFDKLASEQFLRFAGLEILSHGCADNHACVIEMPDNSIVLAALVI